MSTIAIIGTGNVGRTLANGWIDKGRKVLFGSRRPEGSSARAVTEELGASVVESDAAVAAAEVVVLAVPGTIVEEVVGSLGDLDGKVVVDCTNPVGPDLGHVGDPAVSLSERIAAVAPGARVVKCFNTTGTGNMANPAYPQGALAMPLCGDDADAKSVVAELAELLGFEPFDNGPLSQARYLEAVAFIWIHQAFAEGWGPDFGFAVLRR